MSQTNGFAQSTSGTQDDASAPKPGPVDAADERCFDDIRPYRDDEIAPVLRRLIADREFIDTLLGMKFPRLGRVLPWVLRPLVTRALRREFGGVNSIDDFQQIIGHYLNRLLQRTASGFTVNGLEHLDKDQAYVFISNHRDIAMDPALVDLALHNGGMATTRIAIGDNLLTKPFSSDLMRLNKSFIVRRSVSGRREKLQALKQLSRYIRFSIETEGESIWIAQSEGRAKDGIDTTETALLKMLALSKRESEGFAGVIGALHLVPVAISYEWDPCDAAKARELVAISESGAYQKAEHEDLTSIYQGIVGCKGHIYVTFGEPIDRDIEDAEQLARIIDDRVIAAYRLQATHFYAHRRLHGRQARCEQLALELGLDTDSVATAFEQRLSGIPASQVDTLLAAYANPLVRYLQQPA